jgi:hypothetical protein
VHYTSEYRVPGLIRGPLFWKDTTIWKLDLFPFSGEGVGVHLNNGVKNTADSSRWTVRSACYNGPNWTGVSTPFHLRMETVPVPETFCSIWNTRWWRQCKNSAISKWLKKNNIWISAENCKPNPDPVHSLTTHTSISHSILFSHLCWRSPVPP